MPDDFWTLQALRVSLPIIGFILLMMIATITYFVLRHKFPDMLRRKTVANPFERAIFVYSNSLLALYTFIISVALTPFRCFKQEDGSRTLVPASSHNCFDSDWFQNWPTIGLGLLYVILIPVFFSRILILYNENNSQSSNSFHFQYGFLVKQYKREYYWWSMFQVFKKVVLVMVIDLTTNFATYLRTFLVLVELLSTILLETI
jgi:hypothetical protein